MAHKRQRLSENGRTYFLHTLAAHQRANVEEAVEKLEADGWDVYWPNRDNEHFGQEGDGFDFNIENKKQMSACDFVHVMFDGRPSGILFGLGMAFAMEKPVRVVQLPELTKWRSFQNLIDRWRRTKF